jgi:flavin reductase (DIM6/NTAB) family NADH-FMN oxidoreductase RutF
MTDNAENNVLDASFETVVKLLDYPLFVVTTAVDGSQGGCLVGFATQASISPPRYLVCLSDKNRTYRLATRATHLVVHVLGADHRALAELFGGQTGDEVDKFAQCSWRPGPGGAPILGGVAGWFSGRILERLPMGDHVGMLLEPGKGQVLHPDSDLLTLSGVGDLEAAHGA